jgi:glyoxylase-like metal-dependent hydrolase (beta-lactamase superfamily II)
MVRMAKSSLIRAAGSIFGLAGLWVAMTQQPPPQELTVTKVADDLHVIVGSGGNVGVYVTEEGVILVDDKFEQNYQQIVDTVKGVTAKPIRYVLNTHLHGDHSGGNAKFLGAGVEVIAHENAQKLMEERKMPGVPRLSFHNRFTVKLGGKTVTANHFGRGHTQTDAVMHFPERRTIHTGDLFVAGAPFIDYSSGGSAVEWTRTIDRALALDFDTVIPGHGPVMKREDLLKWKQSYETLKMQVSRLRREGKTEAEAKAAVKFDGLPGWGPGRLWDRSFPGLYEELK